MYLLIVGFSEQNSKPISLLLQMNFADTKFSVVERQLSATMLLTFPTLTMVQEQAEAMVIDLEGIGLTRYDEAHQAALLKFINNRPVVLISRRPLKKWQAANFLPETTQFLQCPYDQKQMTDTLTNLQKIVSGDASAISSIKSNNKSNKLQSYYEQKTAKKSKDSHLNKFNEKYNQTPSGLETAQENNKKNVLKNHETEKKHDRTDDAVDSKTNSSTKRQANQASNEMATKTPVSDKLSNKAAKSKEFSSTASAVTPEPVTVATLGDAIGMSRAVDTEVDSDIQIDDTFAVVVDSIHYKIIQKYFPILKNDQLIKYLLAIILAQTPIKVDIKLYQLFIDPNDQSVIINGSNDLTRLVDYFIILNSYKSLGSKIDIEELDDDSYNHYLKSLIQQGSVKQSLHTLMWQVADEVLSKDISEQSHDLTLRILFMPNFSAMRFVPSYMVSLVSACLTIPRSIDDLQRLFPNISMQQLNRFFLLALLSGVADTNIILSNDSLQDMESQGELQDKDKKYQYQQKRSSNQGIKKANKSGFFKRLLSRLAK